jgi:hypothetical protein
VAGANLLRCKAAFTLAKVFEKMLFFSPVLLLNQKMVLMEKQQLQTWTM